MLDDRIAKIETELAVMARTQATMSKSLDNIANTLDRMSSVQTQYQVLNTKVSFMDKELADSFKRVHVRLDDLDRTRSWLGRIVVGLVITAVVGLALKGKL